MWRLGVWGAAGLPLPRGRVQGWVPKGWLLGCSMPPKASGRGSSHWAGASARTAGSRQPQSSRSWASRLLASTLSPLTAHP